MTIANSAADKPTSESFSEQPSDWLNDDETDQTEEVHVDEYDILSAPNDWNVLTIVNYMERGAIKIPSFQRNYVWDIKKASKLIESLLLGLPVPQIFLYEEARNSFLVIDGQQRLLSIFFFLKGRFPKPSARGSLRVILQSGAIQTSMLSNDEMFQDFKLQLPVLDEAPKNRFHGLKYSQLEDYQITLDLRTLRNVVVKQTRPQGNSAIYEIFNRLNTGGVNLAPQEVRASLYHSKFMDAITDLNEDEGWRLLIGKPEPDARMKDVEILLRALALALNSEYYTSPMASFINAFCFTCQGWTDLEVDRVIGRLREIVAACKQTGSEAFQRLNRFSPLLFEAVVCAVWDQPITSTNLTEEKVQALALDQSFVSSLQEGSTKSINVSLRITAARAIMTGK